MTNFNIGDLYSILLNRLRKDRKGAISAEEFESFLRIRSIDYFNQQLGVEGVSKRNSKSLAPFLTIYDSITIQTTLTEGIYWALLVGLNDVPAEFVNVWYSTSDAEKDVVIEVDMVTSAELSDRLNNAITGPSSTAPVGYLDKLRILVYGVTTGYLLIDYYKNPDAPYFDYYVDANGNITYLTDGQAEYTLQAGEVARDGSTSGGVTSVSVDLEWSDQDSMNILDMVMTDAGVAQSDTNVAQASVMERQNNVKS